MITTRLDKPLKDALNINPPDEFIKKGNYKKLIFVLTDGEADDKVKCLSTVQQNISQNVTINTFGIGNDCDKQFCNQLAEEGSGICVILNNQEVSKLRSKVI